MYFTNNLIALFHRELVQRSSAIAFLALYVMAVSVLTSCITTVTDPGALPYEEKIVIRGIVEAGKPLEHIQISRTLPTLAEFSDSAFALPEAEVKIQVRGNTIPLVLEPSTSGQTMFSAPNLIAREGETYTITVKWRTKTATAETTVPQKPQILAVRVIEQLRPSFTTATTVPGADPQIITFIDTVKALESVVMPIADIVYSAGLQIISQANPSVPLTSIFVGQPLRFTDSPPREQVILSGSLPSQTLIFTRFANNTPPQGLYQQGVYQLSLYAFDKAYYDYALTRSRGQQAANLFGGTNGENVLWNVRGDGIGLFIGVAAVQRVVAP